VLTAVSWRRGSGGAAICAAALLAAGELPTELGLLALGFAVCLLLGSEIVLRCALPGCVLQSELSELPAVARYRRRLCSPRRRRSLAAALRRIAFDSSRANGPDFIQWERAGRVAARLHALAAELEAAPVADPRTLLELESLLCDGLTSPLINPAIPEEQLEPILRSIAYRVQTAAPGHAAGSKIGTNTDGKPVLFRLLSGRLARHPVKRRRYG
jgi:hypothetical protein